ncbi:MAG: fibronectin type III domain-containing protein [Lachnospiraceae bacterium]
MRKKITAFALAICLVAGLFGQTSVYASDVTAKTASMETAEEKVFDTNYSITWSEGAEECWSKVTLEENGILGVHVTKPVKQITNEMIKIKVSIFDEHGEKVYEMKDVEETKDGSSYIGLKKGTYYVDLAPEYADSAIGQTSDYKFVFSASDKCELEVNDTKETATSVKVGSTYTGYLGSGYLTFDDNRDEEDLYAIKLTKGQVYKFSCEGLENTTTIVRMLGKDVALNTTWQSAEAENFCVAPGDTFIAPSTGTYYIRVYNYFGGQFKYTFKVTNVTPKATSISKLKAGSKSFSATWKKVSYASGYQVQYSTSKSFKNAKSVKVSSGKTSKTVKSLSAKKKYYVRVRAYKQVGKTYVYSSWSAAKNVTTK